jgi:uncharacterized membrane protein
MKKINQTMLLDTKEIIESGVLNYFLCRINSYWGLFIKANSYNFLKKTMTILSPSFYSFFYFEKYKKSWKCKIKIQFKNNGIILQPASI